MHTKSLLSALALGAIATTASAQVDIIISNISSSAGDYKDCITLFNPATGTSVGTQRPFAQETTDRIGTGSVRDMRYRVVGGQNYIYWVDTISDDVWRGKDGNGDGVIDESEFEQVYDFDAASESDLDEDGGKWWISNGTASGADVGLWLMQDMNADGDFKDAGEATHVISTSTITTSDGYSTSSDDIRGLGMLANGDVIWNEDDSDNMWRTTQAGVTTLWCVYKTPNANTTPTPPINADFASATLPTLSGSMDRISVDRATDTVYMSINFISTQAYVFAAKDGNADGDVQDAGEVTIFYDGVANPLGPIDNFEWFNGTLYGSHEDVSGSTQFWAMTDMNADGDAMDAGEFVLLGQTPPGDDPTQLGLTVFPQGTFAATFAGPNGCVLADLRNSTLTTAGGPITWTFADIPASLQNDSTIGVMWQSLTGDSGIPLPFPPFCFLALTPDSFFVATSGLHNSGVITGATAAAGSLTAPAGLPVGLKIFSWGLFFRTSDATTRGSTETNVTEIRS